MLVFIVALPKNTSKTTIVAVPEAMVCATTTDPVPRDFDAASRASDEPRALHKRPSPVSITPTPSRKRKQLHGSVNERILGGTVLKGRRYCCLDCINRGIGSKVHKELWQCCSCGSDLRAYRDPDEEGIAGSDSQAEPNDWHGAVNGGRVQKLVVSGQAERSRSPSGTRQLSDELCETGTLANGLTNGEL